jgi:hypothetical protein
MDVAFAPAVVPDRAAAKKSRAPLTASRRPREGGDPVTCPSSGPSSLRMRASMVVAFAPAVVPNRAATKTSRAPLTPSRRPREGGDPVACPSSGPSCPRTRASMDVALAVAVVPNRSNSQSVSCAVAPEALFFAGPKKRTQKKGPPPTDLQPATGRHAGIGTLGILPRVPTARVLRAAPSGSHDCSSRPVIRESRAPPLWKQAGSGPGLRLGPGTHPVPVLALTAHLATASVRDGLPIAPNTLVRRSDPT